MKMGKRSAKSRIPVVNQRIKRAQRLIRKQVKRGVSLADELIAERRKEVRREYVISEDPALVNP